MSCIWLPTWRERRRSQSPIEAGSTAAMQKFISKVTFSIQKTRFGCVVVIAHPDALTFGGEFGPRTTQAFVSCGRRQSNSDHPHVALRTTRALLRSRLNVGSFGKRLSSFHFAGSRDSTIAREVRFCVRQKSNPIAFRDVRLFGKDSS